MTTSFSGWRLAELKSARRFATLSQGKSGSFEWRERWKAMNLSVLRR
jgi:hypothetical protein